jgi:hypothetical protein
VRGYRQYGVGLRSLVAARTWEPGSLTAGDGAEAAVRRLLASADPRDVEVALSALADLPDASFADPVDVLLDRSRPVGLRAAAARAASHAGTAGAALDVERLLSDADADLRVAAATALVGHAGQTGALAREVWTATVHDPDPDAVTSALRAAARTPDISFVPELAALAADPQVPAAIGEALVAHAEHLGPVLAGLLVDQGGSRTARERLVAAFAGAGGRGGVLAFDLDRALALQATRAGRVRTLLAGLRNGLAGHDARLQPLVRALGDELAVVAAETAAVLDLASGQRGMARLVASLDSAESGRRALALEAVEVTAGHGRAKLAQALVDPAHSIGDASALPGYPDSAGPVEWLHDLTDDPDRVWQESWLRVCALYAAPVLLGSEAHRLGAAWVDDPDPAVAETARWAMSVEPRPPAAEARRPPSAESVPRS